MNTKQNNSLFFRIFSSKIFFVIFLIIIIYLSINVYREIKQRVEVRKEISNLKMEIKNLDNENNKLGDLIEYFETEEYVESISREKLGYKKPGEKIIIFTEEDSDSILNIEREREELEEGPNIKLWWNYFFNNNEV
jgi:cell division protein FtsB